MSSGLTSKSENQESALAERTLYAVALEVNSEKYHKMSPADLSLLNETLDRIQMMSITDGPSSVYDEHHGWPVLGLCYIPPTTHLVDTIEDLTDMLDYASEEAEDMDEDIEIMPYTVASPTTPNMGKWTATSTYDVYMVDTPKETGDDPARESSRRRRQ